MYMLLMSLTIILLYCSEVKLQHTDKSQILFRFQEKYGTEFTVEKNQPLNIVLDNFFANHAWCLNFYYTGPDDVLVKHTNLNGNSDLVISIPNVTDHMITRWWCKVLQQHKNGKPYNYLGRNYTVQNIVFNLRTKAEVKSTFNMEIIYIICGIGLAVILVAITVTLIKKCCCRPSNNPLLHFKIDVPVIKKETKVPPGTLFQRMPDSIFYVNLEIFRQQYIRESEAEEPEYEEIN